MKQKQISILDCTLRDGGYVNDWNFSTKDIKRTIKKLLKSNIEIIECGFLDQNKGRKSDSTLFKSYEELENLLKDREIILNENQLLVAMVNLNSYDLKTLPNITKDSKVTGIRLAYRRTNYDEAIEQAKILKEKGFQVFMQPMFTISFSNEELKDMLERINTLNPYAVYIVDTSGSMYQDTFLNLFEEVEKIINKDIKLGFHSHNNLQLSYAIAIDFINSIKERDIIIDSSVYGMGRSAGNLNTELLADFLNKKYSKNYEIENILELIDSYFYALYKSNQWGYSLAHFLSASYSVHPNYASYLLDTKRLSINEIKAILEQIPNKNVYEYSKILIEELYFMYNSSKQKLIKEPNINTNKKILLLGSGQNIKSKINELKENRDEYLIISLNHKPDFIIPDFYFFNSQKRYDEFFNTIEKYNIISCSNLEVTTNYTLDYKELSTISDDFQNDISAIMMINYFKNKGLKNIYLAGVDGFKLDLENYAYEEDDKLVDENSINELNSSISKSIEILSKDIKIEFITQTIFKTNLKPRVIGVIPARYASTRLPAKPLADICGLPMIVHTMKRAMMCEDLDEVIVATDDKRIFDLVEKYGGKAMMTDEKHNNGSERMFEVSQTMKGDIYSLINGDEALINPKYISVGINALIDNKSCGVSLLYNKFYKRNSCSDFKVVVNNKSEIMYISRNDIPSECRNNTEYFYKAYHVMSFTKEMLNTYNTLEQTKYDFIESHELLRLLENDYKIQGIEVESEAISVDTKEDLEIVREMMKNDKLFETYKEK